MGYLRQVATGKLSDVFNADNDTPVERSKSTNDITLKPRIALFYRLTKQTDPEWGSRIDIADITDAIKLDMRESAIPLEMISVDGVIPAQ